MFNIKIDIDGLDELKQHIDFIKKLSNMKYDKSFQSYIQEKCLNEVKNVARERLHGTSNAQYYQQYIDSINIPEERKTSNGFEIVSDLTIYKKPSKHSDGYTFSLSLAFEYGTGIVGMGSTDAPPNYRYNVNSNYVKVNGDYESGWWISKDIAGDSVTWGESKNGKSVVTQGYEALEIFRISKNNIEQNLEKWVRDYYKR